MSDKYKNLGRICGVAIAAAYFLPWIDAIIFSFAGYELGKLYDGMAALQSGFGDLMGETVKEEDAVKKPAWVYCTYLFPLIGIASALINKRIVHFLSAVYVLAVLAWIVLSLSSVLQGMSEGSSSEGPSLFSFVGIGLWITILAPFGQIVGGFLCYSSKPDHSIPASAE